MLNVLLESRLERQRRRGGALVSVAAHVAVIAAVVVVTAREISGAEELPIPPLPTVKYIRLDEPKSEAVRNESASPHVSSTPSLPTMQMPDLPRFDFSRPTIGIPEGALTHVGADIASSSPLGSLTGNPYAPEGGGLSSGSAAEPREVDRVARLTVAPSPRYAERLRTAGIEGRVVVQFVVDTLGRVEPAQVLILESAHDDFTAAVREVLPRLRFLPAESDGRKVRMWARMPFEFTLARR